MQNFFPHDNLNSLKKKTPKKMNFNKETAKISQKIKNKNNNLLI